MPHYIVVTHNHADSDTWPRNSGQKDFQTLVTEKLNLGYTCAGGIIKNISEYPFQDQ
jgi:hypothetical protein